VTQTPADRINEFTKRQVYYGSSMVAKLKAVSGKWHYQVYAWINQTNVDTKSLVLEGRYNGEDPLDLIQIALSTLQLKKIKVGRPL
jgi:hypothetical protein